MQLLLSTRPVPATEAIMIMLVGFALFATVEAEKHIRSLFMRPALPRA